MSKSDSTTFIWDLKVKISLFTISMSFFCCHQIIFCITKIICISILFKICEIVCPHFALTDYSFESIFLTLTAEAERKKQEQTSEKNTKKTAAKPVRDGKYELIDDEDDKKEEKR